MATLSIDIPDNAVPRLRAAFGHFDSNQQWVDATAAEVTARVKGFLREQVINYETTKAAMAIREAKAKEQW